VDAVVDEGCDAGVRVGAHRIAWGPARGCERQVSSSAAVSVTTAAVVVVLLDGAPTDEGQTLSVQHRVPLAARWMQLLSGSASSPTTVRNNENI